MKDGVMLFIIGVLGCFLGFLLSGKTSVLENRIAAIETNSTIEIVVERVYNSDTGVYDYQLPGQSEIKRGRKRATK